VAAPNTNNHLVSPGSCVVVTADRCITLPIRHWNPVVNVDRRLRCFLKEGGTTMKQSEIFRENAENCAHLAEAAKSDPAFLRYKRMEAAWLALAEEQDWLDGEVSPTRGPVALDGKTGSLRSSRSSR
jgi:hypothetical protein